ncbi:MAG: hypothetical protein IPP36_07715 [Nitrosomonadales bacterium]|nr:hypothetical protein [Nitrosomonadales bacterium]
MLAVWKCAQINSGRFNLACTKPLAAAHRIVAQVSRVTAIPVAVRSASRDAGIVRQIKVGEFFIFFFIFRWER